MADYMNNFGSYPQYGMGPQPNFNSYASVGQPGAQNPFNNLANFYAQQQQQRLNQMASPMPTQPQVPQTAQPAPMATGYTIRPASNIDEVRATPIEMMTTNVFVNLASDEIYISRIDMEKGNKDIKVYRVVDENAPTSEQAAVPIQDLRPVEPDFSGVYERFDAMERRIDLLFKQFETSAEPPKTKEAKAK